MYKQVIVVNKSLNMSPGKLGAMVAHGATSFFCEWFKRNVVTSNETYNDYLINPNARVDKELFAQWISGSFTKIVLEVEGDPAVGRNGFHFCKDLDDVFRYYPFDFHNRYFKVKALVKKEEYNDRLFAALAAKEIILYEEVFPEYEDVKQYLKCTSNRYHEPYQFTEEDFNGAKEMSKEVYFKNKFISALVKLGHSHLLSELVVEQCSCDVAYMKHIIDVATALKDEGVSRDMSAYILLGGIHEVK